MFVLDGQRHLGRDRQTRGASPAASRHLIMVAGSCRISLADSHGMDRIVKRGSKKARKREAKSSPDQSAKTRMRIEAAIRRIPKGKVSTYGAVARAAGLPGAARLSARALHRGFGLPSH